MVFFSGANRHTLEVEGTLEHVASWGLRLAGRIKLQNNRITVFYLQNGVSSDMGIIYVSVRPVFSLECQFCCGRWAPNVIVRDKQVGNITP